MSKRSAGTERRNKLPKGKKVSWVVGLLIPIIIVDYIENHRAPRDSSGGSRSDQSTDLPAKRSVVTQVALECNTEVQN